MILTVTNLFLKWAEAIALPDKRATLVADSSVNLLCNKAYQWRSYWIIVPNFIMRYGYYNYVISDK